MEIDEVDENLKNAIKYLADLSRKNDQNLIESYRIEEIFRKMFEDTLENFSKEFIGQKATEIAEKKG